ncbi:hypothetical protein PYW08_000046 [Mythimna loreyi]|uniref:Uncharacterized protein n=1 Tax=Mythimna loreyi TaxID=667449 RepID=A0ACC2RBZ2_9NEOP|nr:hypothetical protein PYW08_000046 [Mythimna loreyi]
MDTSPTEAAQVVALLDSGLSQRVVAARLHLSLSSVHRVYKRYRETGLFTRRSGSGRNRVTSERDDRFIVTTSLRNRRLNAFQLQQRFRVVRRVAVSDSTIRRRLKDRGLVPHKPANGPKLTADHRRARLNFAREHLNWSYLQWSKVLFSDECKIMLYGNDGRNKVYRRDGERYAQCCIEEKVSYGGGSWTVWGGISADGKTELAFVSGPRLPALNCHRYVEECLEPHVMPYAHFIGNGFIFMHDNARAHTAGVVRDYLNEVDISIMEWPARSPDMNPIEHLWDELKRRIRARDPAPETLSQLQDAIQEEWDNIPQHVIVTLIRSMKNRMEAVIRAQGGNTSY